MNLNFSLDWKMTLLLVVAVIAVMGVTNGRNFLIRAGRWLAVKFTGGEKPE